MADLDPRTSPVGLNHDEVDGDRQARQPAAVGQPGSQEAVARPHQLRPLAPVEGLLHLPERPAGTDGLSEEALAAIVTRDSMIGVGILQEQGGRP